jgi:RND family efflux transporter MFP subunit
MKGEINQPYKYRNNVMTMVNIRINRIYILIMLIVISGCSIESNVPTPTALPTQILPQKPTYTVERGTVSKVLELRGRVSAVKQQDLFFRASGSVEEVFVGQGDAVEAGQVLAYLSDRENLEFALVDAQIEVILAEREFQSLTDEIGLRRAEALLELFEAQNALEEAQQTRSQLELPRANQITIDQAQIHYESMEDRLEQAQQDFEEVKHLPENDTHRLNALQNLSEAQRQRDLALATLNWYKGSASQDEIDKADALIDLAQARLEIVERQYERIKNGPDPYEVALADARLRRAYLNLNKAQTSLEGMEITAPFAGQVYSLSLAPGMQVNAFTSVITVVEPGSLEITVLPSPGELADLMVGQAATVRLANHPGQDYAAQVRYVPVTTSNVSGAGQPVDQNVRISLENGMEALVLGEIATVIIELEKREDVLWLPLAALRTFQGRDFVLIQDGEIQRRVDVQLGLKSQDRVEVLDGLSEGQVVIGP